MTRNRRCRALLCSAALYAAAAAAQEPQMAFDGGVAWHCGGVGADARQAMKALEPQSNVRLLFVTARRGGYLAGADVRIDDGKATLFSASAEGPICLLRLRPGKYRISAEIGDVRRTAQLSVGAQAGRPHPLVFTFPGEPWDGVWASDEEKRQARE